MKEERNRCGDGFGYSVEGKPAGYFHQVVFQRPDPHAFEVHGRILFNVEEIRNAQMVVALLSCFR